MAEKFIMFSDRRQSHPDYGLKLDKKSNRKAKISHERECWYRNSEIRLLASGNYLELLYPSEGGTK